MRVLSLDPEAPADEAGFRSLSAAVSAVNDLPPEAWRIVGGWMVRGWAELSGSEVFARQTIDADLELLPNKAVERSRRVPQRLRDAGLAPADEPFRFRGEDGARVDLLVAPGSSRHDPPRLGGQEVFEVEGSRLAFTLPPERVVVRRGAEKCTIQIPRLAAALVIKAILVAKGRRLRVRDDAQDVAALLRAVRNEPEPVVSDLIANARGSEVKRARRALKQILSDERARAAEWISQELGSRASLTAIADARWLADQL